MDAETTRLKDATVALKAEEKDLRAQLKGSTAQVPLAELRTAVHGLEMEKADLSARLAKLKSGNIKPIRAEERDKVNAEHRKWQKCANARRKIRKDMWDEIAGILPKDKWAETKEELGLEF